MSRAVLPPLEVEVVAGDEHRTIPASNKFGQSGPAAQNTLLTLRQPLLPRLPTLAVPAAWPMPPRRVHLSPGAAEILSRPVEPNYPLLAKQMKVQGAVVLEALIGRDGNIQDLHVLSGPTILSRRPGKR